jgi:hypothetical protein
MLRIAELCVISTSGTLEGLGSNDWPSDSPRDGVRSHRHRGRWPPDGSSAVTFPLKRDIY